MSESASMAPTVSVLIPTYNYARYLPAALESVLAQAGTDFEVIVSDDASTDDSANVILRYAANHPRVRVTLHTRNLGMVANWNYCLGQARGTYVKFLFGDDVLASRFALSRLVDLITSRPGLVLAGSARLLLDRDTQITGRWDELPPGVHPGGALIAQCFRRRRNLLGEPSAMLFRRVDALRGFDSAYRQVVDLELWFYLLQSRGGAFIYTDEPLCAFRRHDAQQTAANRQARVSDLEMIALLERYLPTPGVASHLRIGSAAHRLILFRQWLYARRAASQAPAAATAVARLRAQLPLPWLVACWLWHRLARPLTHLRHTVSRWLHRLAAVAASETRLRRGLDLAFLTALQVRVTDAVALRR